LQYEEKHPELKGWSFQIIDVWFFKINVILKDYFSSINFR
jgi:hypothetical protein